MFDAVIGLGSNLGDRGEQIQRAARGLAELGEVLGTSAIYETEPVGEPQPKFLNAALRLRTELQPEDLLERLLDIERRLGRVRKERWGPRVIDLDILWCLGVTVRTERLVVPHPELRRRAFALVPLLDVAPDARDPEDDASYADLLAAMDAGGVVEVPGTRSHWFDRPGVG